MAEEKKKGYWFTTETGKHVYVEEGQTPEEATKKALANAKSAGESKKAKELGIHKDKMKKVSESKMSDEEYAKEMEKAQEETFRASENPEESKDMAYQFPELTKEDLERAKEYGLKPKAKFMNGDIVLVGSMDNLEMFADEHLGGYELNEDYLTADEDFDYEDLAEQGDLEMIDETEGKYDYSNKSISELDEMGFYGDHNRIIQGMRNSNYDSYDEVMKVADYYELNDKQKAYVDAYARQLFGVDDEHVKEGEEIKKAANEQDKAMLERQKNKSKESEEKDAEISEALSDFSWQITDDDTVGSYAESVANKIGYSKEEVLAVMSKEAGRELAEGEQMAKVIEITDKNEGEPDVSKLSLDEARKLYNEGKISLGQLDDVAIRISEEKGGATDEYDRLQKIVDERVKQGWDYKGTHDPQSIKDTGYLGYGSLEALEKATFKNKENKAEETDKFKTFENADSAATEVQKTLNSLIDSQSEEMEGVKKVNVKAISDDSIDIDYYYDDGETSSYYLKFDKSTGKVMNEDTGEEFEFLSEDEMSKAKASADDRFNKNAKKEMEAAQNKQLKKQESFRKKLKRYDFFEYEGDGSFNKTLHEDRAEEIADEAKKLGFDVESKRVAASYIELKIKNPK